MVNIRTVRNWSNEQATVKLNNVTIYRPSNITGTRVPRFFNGLDDLITITKEASNMGLSLCAVGSTWSLSSAVAATGSMVNTRYLGEVPAIGLEAQYSSHVDRGCLVFCQAGVEIAQLNRILASRDLSLQVSGASNGQTLVGAISTGTHGSAFRVGGLAETVLGIHLVTKNGESLWTERKSGPVVKPKWADYLGAKLTRDDELFSACLVSFGTFGLIHGMPQEVPVSKAPQRSPHWHQPRGNHIQGGRGSFPTDGLPSATLSSSSIRTTCPALARLYRPSTNPARSTTTRTAPLSTKRSAAIASLS